MVLFENCSYVNHGLVYAIKKTSSEALYYVDTNQKLVALTIDDSPDSLFTEKILQVLDSYNAKATFFIITNRIGGNEHLIEKMISHGHELGNHMTTDESSIQLSSTEFTQKFNEADSLLSCFGKVQWFRPGSGWFNEEMIQYIEKKGYKCVLGSVYPIDPTTRSSWFSTVYIKLTARKGSIIILHDGGKRGERTVKTLKNVIPYLQEKGFRFVTLSELYETRNYNNH